jgi:DNA-binding transcriptional LysR family regulator
MDLRHFRYFIAVAEEGHITRAAERLGMQQPPLSRQIRAIERELDVQLFRRTARGVEMTDAGRAFLANARAMLALLDQTFEMTRRTARGEQGRISVGAASSAAYHPLVPSVIREFREAFPLVSVTLTEGHPFDLIERMRNDEIDVVFIRTPVNNPEEFAMERLLEESVVVALPSGHALAQNENGGSTALSLNALADETFILYGRPDGTLTLLTTGQIAACHAAGFSPRVGHVVPHMLSRLNLVAAGLGIALVSASLQRMNIEGVTYRCLKGKGEAQLKVPLNLASRRGDASAVVRQFSTLVKKTAKHFRVAAVS